MDRGRVGEDRGSKEADGCPLTARSLSQKNKTSKSGRLASGYNPTWLKNTKSVKKSKDDTSVICGLTDKDAYDKWPDFLASRTKSHSNKVCTLSQLNWF
jgi:hypothetical protein